MHRPTAEMVNQRKLCCVVLLRVLCQRLDIYLAETKLTSSDIMTVMLLITVTAPLDSLYSSAL